MAAAIRCTGSASTAAYSALSCAGVYSDFGMDQAYHAAR